MRICVKLYVAFFRIIKIKFSRKCREKEPVYVYVCQFRETSLKSPISNQLKGNIMYMTYLRILSEKV